MCVYVVDSRTNEVYGEGHEGRYCVTPAHEIRFLVPVRTVHTVPHSRFLHTAPDSLECGRAICSWEERISSATHSNAMAGVCHRSRGVPWRGRGVALPRHHGPHRHALVGFDSTVTRTTPADQRALSTLRTHSIPATFSPLSLSTPSDHLYPSHVFPSSHSPPRWQRRPLDPLLTILCSAPLRTRFARHPLGPFDFRHRASTAHKRAARGY